MRNTPDTVLVVLLKKGSYEAYTEIYNRHKGVVGNMGIAILRSNIGVNDIVQDIFESLWKNREQLNIEGSLKNYLLTAARNKSIDILRSGVHQQNYTNEQEYKQGKEEDPGKQLEDKDMVNFIYEVAHELCTVTDSRALQLRYKYDMSYEDVALEMGTTVPNTRVYVNRALKTVREFLKNNN